MDQYAELRIGLAMIAEPAFSPSLLLGHLAALLLVASVLLPQQGMARIAALAAGGAFFLLALLVLNLPVYALWALIFVGAHGYQLYATSGNKPKISHPLDPQDHYFHQSAIPFLEQEQARDLLAIGSEVAAGPDTILTREGERISQLYFLTDGSVEIESGNRRVATVSAGSFIGEVGLLTGEPATATAISLSPVKFIAFDKGALKELFDSDPEIERALELGFKRELREKLIRANEAMSRKA